MEFLIVIFIIIVIIILLTMRNSLVNKLDRLEHEVNQLRKELSAAASRPVASAAPASPAAAPAAGPSPAPALSGPSLPPPPAGASPARPAIPPPPRREPQKGFFERHPDLENFIGENLISKIGIAILVLAIGFFVKYAIDNNWIGPIGRVGVGLVCGGILVGLAHRLRRQYKAFSSVLVGGGLAVFYFTIALAYHQYHIFGQTATFIIMLVVTAFAVLLSLFYDREELAIISLVGGFVTPFLVSNGSGDYQVLFTYLLILNTGLLVIAYRKTWRLLNGLSFAFTAILFASWLIRLPYDAAKTVYHGGAAFATAFYVLFFVVNIAHTIRENKKFIASDLGILLVNTCLYFGASLYFLSQLGLDRYKGLFCAVMGVFHIGISWLLFRKQTVDKNILYLLIGITLSFVSLTAPLQLHGHYITLFWASESVLLYWLFLKSQLRLIRLSSRLIGGAMLVSLLIDWAKTYIQGSDSVMPVIINAGFMTGLFCSLCCYALFRLQRESSIGLVELFTGLVVLFISGMAETIYQFSNRYPDSGLSTLYPLLYTWLFILAFTFANRRLKGFDFRLLSILLLGLGILIYLIMLPDIYFFVSEMADHELPQHLSAHWPGAIAVIAILYRTISLFRTGVWRFPTGLFSWSICIIVVIFLSAEGLMLVDVVFYSAKNPIEDLERIYNKTCLPILWGLSSFGSMWLGMRYKFKPLRIFSLSLFSVTLIKLFFFDIVDIPVAGKIAAFFCLGVLLLVVSFMYQRLKKIIIEDDKQLPD